MNNMRRTILQSDPRDRAKSAAAAAAIHVVFGAAFLTGLALQPERGVNDSLKTFDVKEPPPPPPPTIESTQQKAKQLPALAGESADPSPVVAPPARIPTAQPIAAVPIAGTGSSSNAGADASGSGTGAGGSGTGRGGHGGGIGTEARLLSGHRARLPRQLLRPFAADGGYAHLLLTVSNSGRVTACGVTQGTGSADVDQALCQVMIQQSRWSVARDTLGRPITVHVRYTATWSKN